MSVPGTCWEPGTDSTTSAPRASCSRRRQQAHSFLMNQVLCGTHGTACMRACSLPQEMPQLVLSVKPCQQGKVAAVHRARLRRRRPQQRRRLTASVRVRSAWKSAQLAN